MTDSPTVERAGPLGPFTASGPDVPTVVLARSAAASTVRNDVPIGTRVPEELTLTIDGAAAAITPSRGRFSRRSYRIRVRLGEHDWLFTPATPEESRLVRGTRYRGDNEIGMFTLDDDGDVTVAWSEDISALGVTVTGLPPTPTEAALGHVLAAGFGTGARIMVAAVVAAAGEMFW